MLGRHDVGHRVVVRRVVGVRADRPLYSDALGELTELSETHLTVVTDRGPLRVPLDRVARAKRVPPRRRPGRAEVVGLELAADRAWPAPEHTRLGGWLLRAAHGWTGRANSALPVGDPGTPLEDAIDTVCAWYRDRGLPPLMNVPLPLCAPVNAALDARGWGVRPPTDVLAAPLGRLRDAAPARPDLPAVQLAGAPSDAWLGMVSGRKGGLPPGAHHVLTAVPQVTFAHVYDSGELVAVGRGTVTGGRWLGVFLVEVAPDARRRGLARQVISALTDWAGGRGADRAYLQVEQHNAPAQALYAALGFTRHHAYLTRTAPD